MGLNYKTKKRFLTVSGGKLVERVDPGTPGSEERTNKLGKVVHETRADSISGQILDIAKESHPEYGDSIQIRLHDGGEEFTIQIKYPSGYSRGFLNRIEAVDPSRYVELLPYYIEQEDGTFKAYFGIIQDQKKIPSKYTKETPNGMPQLVSSVVGKKTVYDDTDQLAFYDKIITDSSQRFGSIDGGIEGDIEAAPTADLTDDLPF